MVGSTSGTLPGQSSAGHSNAFVIGFTTDGTNGSLLAGRLSESHGEPG